MLPLSGVVVLDLTQAVAGPYFTMFLADAGARVIKVEPPGTGEMYRHEGPRIEGLPAGQPSGGFQLRLGRNKESVTLDLKSGAGRELFLRLIEKADVVAENFRVGTMERLRLGYEVLRARNPRIIYTTVTGFGHTDIYESPFYDRTSFAIIAEAMSGVVNQWTLSGELPRGSGVALGDTYTGQFALSGTLLALRHRDLTGEGQHVDVSMYDALTSLCERLVFTYARTGREPGPGSSMAPFGIYPTRDGFVAIAVVGAAVWKRFARAIGRDDLADDPDYQRTAWRNEHMVDIIDPLVNGWLADKTKVEAVDLLAAHGVPIAPVQTNADLLQCPHLAARNMIVEFDHPYAGPTKVAGNPMKFSSIPEASPRPSPLMGEHTDRVLADLLDLDAAAIADLHERGVV